MERIQSAIQKAREERGNSDGIKTGNTASLPANHLQTPQSDPASIFAPEGNLWANLPKLELKPKQLSRARVYTDQATEAAAAFDVLRTRMMHQIKTNNWRRVAISSPGSACGKTTLCMNLAFSFARQRNIRTMVIDLDMRRPSIDKILKASGQRFFASALERESAPEDHMICHQEKLAFATNSKPTQNPAELLQDKGAAHVIDQLEERYKPDVMLFDTPPMLACDDTFAFLDQFDCVLLVAAAERTTADELEKCKKDIGERCNLMGVVLNKCRHLSKVDTYGY